MAEYIERDAARPDVFCIGVSCQDCPFLKSPLYGGCRIDDFIASIPAADVRPVVRCRDCKHWFNAPVADGFNSCELDALIRHEDFFCAAGEKRC